MSVKDFQQERAINIACEGKYKLHRWYGPDGKIRTLACRSTRVSPYRMIVDVPVVGRIGDHITSHFGEFGEFEGTISDSQNGSILLELEMTPERRQWMADKLAWLEMTRRDPMIQDARKDARFVPQVSHTTLTMADGKVSTCFIIDVSATGVAVSSEFQPKIGTPLAVGSLVGRVVRIFETGFAVQFLEKQNLNDLNRLIIRTEPKSTETKSTETGSTETKSSDSLQMAETLP
ncbi:MAG: PilZ domain-containing protein [Bradyrhizobium sp.]|nr:PilZ domain-containing protein [Bradyrhizobium sp.]